MPLNKETNPNQSILIICLQTVKWFQVRLSLVWMIEWFIRKTRSSSENDIVDGSRENRYSQKKKNNAKQNDFNCCCLWMQCCHMTHCSVKNTYAWNQTFFMKLLIYIYIYIYICVCVCVCVCVRVCVYIHANTHTHIYINIYIYKEFHKLYTHTQIYVCIYIRVCKYIYIYIHIYICVCHPTSRQLYGHLPPITKTIQARRTRHAGHCWRSKDEIVSDVLLWTPAYGQSKAGRPARTYIQQLCDDTGCNPEDLPEAMNDRETWRERVRDIRASRTSWWWWWYIY